MIKEKNTVYLLFGCFIALFSMMMFIHTNNGAEIENGYVYENISFSAGATKAANEIVESVENETLITVEDVDAAFTTTGLTNQYTEQDLWALAHLIYAEGGSEACSDKLRYYIGSVVLNRVNHWYYPDTIEGVIFDEGQYECTWIGTYYNEPSEKCWAIAQELLENGSVLPENVVFQASFEQGDGVYEYLDGTYFCYCND